MPPLTLAFVFYGLALCTAIAVYVIATDAGETRRQRILWPALWLASSAIPYAGAALNLISNETRHIVLVAAQIVMGSALAIRFGVAHRLRS